MIRFTIKSIIYFSLSFMILSIKVGKAPLFVHMYQLMGPFGKKSIQRVKDDFSETFYRTRSLGQKIFSDSEIEYNLDDSKNVKDQIQTKNASHRKALERIRRQQSNRIIRDEIKKSEKSQLNRLFQ